MLLISSQLSEPSACRYIDVHDDFARINHPCALDTESGDGYRPDGLLGEDLVGIDRARFGVAHGRMVGNQLRTWPSSCCACFSVTLLGQVIVTALLSIPVLIEKP